NVDRPRSVLVRARPIARARRRSCAIARRRPRSARAIFSDPHRPRWRDDRTEVDEWKRKYCASRVRNYLAAERTRLGSRRIMQLQRRERTVEVEGSGSEL